LKHDTLALLLLLLLLTAFFKLLLKKRYSTALAPTSASTYSRLVACYLCKYCSVNSPTWISVHC